MIRILRLFATIAVLHFPAYVYGAWFMPLPQLAGSTQAGDAFGVSADGSTVVGTSHDGNAFQAVRWTLGPQITMQTLGAGAFSYALGVSADGGAIVGNGTTSRGYPLAFRWTQASGANALGDFPGGEEASAAYDVSADGSVVVGAASTAQGGEAFRWTSSTGLMSIGDLAGGILGGSARGISSNGSVVVGSGVSDSGTEAFRWAAETGMIGLGDLPGGGFYSEAYDVSANGLVVAGRSAANSGLFPYRAFRWTVDAGIVALPDLVGVGPVVRAEGISGDGNVVVGTADDSVFGQAFVWDSLHGSRKLTDVLNNQGVDLAGWKLQVARSASSDGLTIVGLGINPEFAQQPWVARLDPGTFVPEPSSLTLSALSMAALIFFAWRRRRASG
jgi:probable HAF family extracellular repeat protein